MQIKETFLSIQGEGFYAGQSSFFIRTQGCDIGCHWCDEPNSWDFNSGLDLNLEEILFQIEKSKTNIVVVTGGEPLIHNLNSMTELLKNAGYTLHLETSGAYSITGVWDWVTLSPKKIKPPLPEVYAFASELKIIIYNKDDFKWAVDQAEKVNKDCLLYIQPEWSKRGEIEPLIFDFISKNPHWRLSLQTHKYLNIK